jgi:hypothetical protein
MRVTDVVQNRWQLRRNERAPPASENRLRWAGARNEVEASENETIYQ